MKNSVNIEQNFERFENYLKKLGLLYVIFKTIKGLIFLIIFVPFIVYLMNIGKLPNYIGIPTIIIILAIYLISTLKYFQATTGKNTLFQNKIKKSLLDSLKQHNNKV